MRTTRCRPLQGPEVSDMNVFAATPKDSRRRVWSVLLSTVPPYTSSTSQHSIVLRGALAL